jgi:membrane fusion protein (multidrug efflux system)
VQGPGNVDGVDGTDTAHNREVSVGPKIGSDWLIPEGLKPGERVIYEGLQKVKDGAKVKPTVADANSNDPGKK